MEYKVTIESDNGDVTTRHSDNLGHAVYLATRHHEDYGLWVNFCEMLAQYCEDEDMCQERHIRVVEFLDKSGLGSWFHKKYPWIQECAKEAVSAEAR